MERQGVEVSRPVRAPRLVRWSLGFLAVPMLMTGAVAGAATGPASARTASPGAAASFTVKGGLAAVAAVSARRAWAVGFAGSLLRPAALIAAWDGSKWKRVPSPSPGTGASLSGVAAVSASSAWAVGSTSNGAGTARTLILRWNGAAWRRVPSPSPGSTAVLLGVAVVSARSAWAVGTDGTLPKTLALRWNGTTWKRVPSPAPAFSERILRGVAATASGTAWAVGCSTCSTGSGFNMPLTERWNGRAWKAAGGPAAHGILAGVAVTSARSAWAVGSAGGGKTLILRWNGGAWK
jgi:hypothetical protein